MKKLLLIPGLAAAVFSCSQLPFSRQPASVPGNAGTVTYLDQGWDQKNRQIFYYTPQGSHLMPYDWARKMENARDQQLFLTSANLSRFGYIPEPPTSENPDGLPVGFTKDIERKQAGLGINCAACHTSQISYRGKEIRIDGGASLSDFQGFIKAMDASINAAYEDSAKFDRFSARVLGNTANAASREQLRKDLAELVRVRADWQTRNGSSMVYGHGRNDAFGIIFNQVLARDLKKTKGGAPLTENRRDPDAPVSYPVLWDAPYHDIVQWIGIARNNLEDKGPLSRNIGQVLGVFGHVDFDKETLILKGYCSSAKRTNLEALENEVKTLWSPKWPEEILGALDKAKVERGAKLFQNTCVKCHQSIDSRSPTRLVRASMVPVSVVKTDPKVAMNASQRTAFSGQVRGKKMSIAEGRELEEIEPATVVLRHAVAGALVGSISFLTCSGEIETNRDTIVNGWRKVAHKAGAALFTKEEIESPAGTMEERLAQNGKIFNRYKARPLNGVWSAAPYLHNGSVKNLYEMLLPEGRRSREFTVGCSKFDPVKVGFECDRSEGTTQFRNDISGNSNSGHEFAAGLSEAERGDLLEYLKSL